MAENNCLAEKKKKKERISLQTNSSAEVGASISCDLLSQVLDRTNSYAKFRTNISCDLLWELHEPSILLPRHLFIPLGR